MIPTRQSCPAAPACARASASSAHEALVAAVIQGRRRGQPLHEHLGQAVLGDYAAGRTGWLDGRMLSQTEGRLAALLGLTVQRRTQAGAGIPR